MTPALFPLVLLDWACIITAIAHGPVPLALPALEGVLMMLAI